MTVSDDPASSVFASVNQDRMCPPVPLRYWWLKRISFAAMVLLLAMSVLRVWWGFEAERRRAREIATYQAAGEPVRLADFSEEVPPREQNAAFWLMDAANAIVGGAVSVDDAYGHIQIWRDSPDGIRALVGANARALALVRKARACDRAYWDLPIGHNATASAQIWTVLSSQRQLARLLDVAAAIAFDRGARGEAVELLRDLSFQARMIRRHPSLTAQLVAHGVERILCTRIERFGNSLFQDTTDQGTHVERAAIEESLRVLQEDLLDEREWRENLLRTGYAERALLIDTPPPAAATGVSLLSSWLLRPLHRLERTHGVRQATLVAHATACGSLKEAETRLEKGTFDSGEGALRSWIAMPAGDSSRGRLTSVFSTLAYRRLTATAIALQRFRADKGAWPETLDELYPEYLGALPDDPCCAAGGRLLYLVGQPEPRLYSKGLNGLDDGGVEVRPARSRTDTADGDIVFNLDGRSYRGNARSRFVPPPLPQAERDDKDEGDAQPQSTEHRDEAKKP